jgi:hypothetical protein
MSFSPSGLKKTDKEVTESRQIHAPEGMPVCVNPKEATFKKKLRRKAYFMVSS